MAPFFILIAISSLVSFVRPFDNVDYLERLNVAGRPLTMSGFSSGGSMAIQMQIAFSGHFDGVAAFSATWYRCGAFGRLFYRTICSSGLYPFAKGLHDARRYEQEGLIDPLENLRPQKFYHWIGRRDELAAPASRLQSGEFYKAAGMSPENIKIELSDPGHHFMPTANKSHPSCTQKLAFQLAFDSSLVGVSYCDYDGAFEGLNFLLSNSLTRPDRSVPLPLEPLRRFNQSVFLEEGSQQILDPIGFYYVPSKCQRNGVNPCHFHVSLHGCLGARNRVGEEFVRQSGYLEVAEVNNIVILFPQSVPFNRNKMACWDYNSSTGDKYATKEGVQMKALARIIGQATGQKLD